MYRGCRTPCLRCLMVPFRSRFSCQGQCSDAFGELSLRAVRRLRLGGPAKEFAPHCQAPVHHISVSLEPSSGPYVTDGCEVFHGVRAGETPCSRQRTYIPALGIIACLVDDSMVHGVLLMQRHWWSVLI